MTQDMTKGNYVDMDINKRRLVIVAIAALVTATIIGIIIFSGSPAQKIKKQLDLGQKYLSELNYEQAVASFKEALAIDSTNPDAIKGLMASYSGWGDDLVNNSKYDEAITILIEAFDAFPNNQDVKNQLVQTYLDAAEYRVNKKQYDSAIRLLQDGYERTKSETIKKRLGEITKEYNRIMEEQARLEEERKKKEEALSKINKENLTALANWMIDLANHDMYGKPMQDWTGSDLLSEIDSKRSSQHIYGDNSQYRSGHTYLNGERCYYDIADTNPYTIQLQHEGKQHMTLQIYDNHEHLDAYFYDMGLEEMTQREFLSMFQLEGILDYWDDISSTDGINMQIEDNCYLFSSCTANNELVCFTLNFEDKNGFLYKSIAIGYFDRPDSKVDRIWIDHHFVG